MRGYGVRQKSGQSGNGKKAGSARFNASKSGWDMGGKIR